MGLGTVCCGSSELQLSPRVNRAPGSCGYKLLNTELQTHVSARDVVSGSSSLQTQPNPSRYPATFSSPNPRPNSTHNDDSLSDAFTDHRPANAVTAQHALIQDSSSQILIVHPEENNNLKHESEPSLMNGMYDEEESAKSFQDAVRQWREAGPSTAQEPMWALPHTVTVADVPTQADLSPGEGGVGRSVPVQVEFSEHGLTLLDRLLLKKHRRNPIELPPLINPHEKPLPQTDDKELLTYLTSLFAVPTNAERSGLDNSTPGTCLTIEVLDEEDSAVDVEAKRMVNRIIPAHQTADPKNRTSDSLSPRTTQQLILSEEMKDTKTSLAVYSDLTSKPEPIADTPGDRHTSIKTATAKSPAKSRESPASPVLSSSAPLYRPPKSSSSPFSFCPNDSFSAGRSLTSEECRSYPKISPALRTTFTLSPSGSVDTTLLPKISSQKPSGSHVKSSKTSLRSLLDLDAVLSDDERPVSQSSSKLSTRSGCPESRRQSGVLSGTTSRLSGDDTHEDDAVCSEPEHDMTGRESMSKRREQRLLSDLSLNDNSSCVPTGRHEAVSAGNAKESTFALIREYSDHLKSMQDSEDEMSCDSLDLSQYEEEESADEDSQACSDSHRSTHNTSAPARGHREKDLCADEVQQLSEPAQVIHTHGSASDDSSDDTPSPLSVNSPNPHRKIFDALHQTSLNSSTSTEWSEAEMEEMSELDQTGCEDPDMEADTTEHTVSRLERELRMLVKESGSEVFTVAPGNSRMENPRGNGLCTRKRMTKEEEDEEEALQSDRRSVLLLP
ncbi:hypothetical protein WMY93_029034 [Mugilogobius chulae]|uniref:Uncharacterized protein n=1 Tax=Mugilogobius chulae TaxID=88201 RepID=A0AAW0MR38_9GOBI